MRVAVAMSGGVDSSVAAFLLAREGAEVVGLSMHLWGRGAGGPGGAADGRCCTADDLATARRAAETIGVPHYVLDLTDTFARTVVRPFVEGYLAGETPIPCLACNTDVKFKGLLARAEALGCEAVATGHFARTEPDPAGSGRRLLRGVDPAKDQSYFLWDLTPDQLSRALFPVGGLTKSEVRRIAREAGLPNWDKKESQEICFVPRGEGPADFIRREAEALGIPLAGRMGALAGEVVDRGGQVIGRHEGVLGFTVGQRRGLGISGGPPLYVLDVDPEAARVVAGPEEALGARVVELREVNHLVSPIPVGSRPVLARVRYRHSDAPARLEVPTGATRRGGTARLVFESPVRAPAPGQSAVFFDPARSELVLGGGVIAAAF